MRPSERALLSLLLCRTALPVDSVFAAETWPWSRRASQPAPPRAPDSTVEGRLDEAGAAASAVQRSAPADGGEGTVRRPTSVGCYMRMPSGCPRRPDVHTRLWRHDPWAEKDGLDEARCMERAAVWNGFCDTQDAEMAFVLKQ